MATLNACMDSLMRQGLTQAEAQAVVSIVRDTVANTRNPGNAAAEAAKRLQVFADSKKHAALVQKRQAAINIVKRDQINSFIDSVTAEGGSITDAIEALLVGSGKRFTGARDSAAAKGSSLRALWAGSLANELEKLGVVKLLTKDRKFADAVMIEMIEPNKTGDKLARDTADVFSRYLEEMRLRANEAGADIGKLDNYAPQSHDPIKLSRAGKDAWVKYISERLDWDRTFPEVEAKDIPNLLSEIYDEIVTGVRKPKADSVRQEGGVRAPANMANRMAKERSLHFRDGQAAVEYQQKFSNGTVVDAMMRRLEASSRKVGLMQTFGPNPEYMIQNIIGERIQAAADNPELATKLQNAWRAYDRGGWLMNRFRVLAGETGTPVNLQAARIFGWVRGITSMAKLGGAVLSSFADIGLKVAAARHSGVPFLERIRQGFLMRFEGMQSEEKVQLGRSLGVYTNALLGEMYNRFDITDAANGMMNRWMNVFFKLSGLEGWTEAHKAAYAYYLSNRMAQNAGVPWASLNADYRAVLEKNGMERYWPVMQHLVQKVEGEDYVIPENARRLADADIEYMLPPEYQAMPAGVDPAAWQAGRAEALDGIRKEIEQKAMSFITDEVSYAVLEPDAKVRAMMYQGTRPGTVQGEMLRLALQFKAFSVTYMQRYMSEARWQRASKQKMGGYEGVFDKGRVTADMPGFVEFFLITTVLGYLSGVAKDLTKGRTPRDITANPIEVTMAAILQGGGLGILGDFFLGETDRFGNQLAAQAVGPSISSFLNAVPVSVGMLSRGDAGKAAETAAKYALDNIPFANLWYTRQAMDFLVNYHVREFMSPGALKRAEQKMKKEFNQTYLHIGDIDLTPSKHIKRGGGFK